MALKRMMKKIFLSAIITSISLGMFGNTICNYEVKTAFAAKSMSVEDRIDHITTSLKTNYLGLKNVGQWQEYISEARRLNDELSNVTRKTINAKSLDKAESLVNAAARVNKVEQSMSENALIMKNTTQWEYYIKLAKEDLKNVDLTTFRYQHSELTKRAEKSQEGIDNIKKAYFKTYGKIEEMYNEALRLEDDSRTDALKQAKRVKELALNLESYENTDYIIERADKLIKRLTDDEVATTNGDFKEISINNKDDIGKLDSEKYNKVEIDTWSEYYDKRITNLKANTLIIKGAKKITLENCDIGKLVIEDSNNSVDLVVSENTIVERTLVKSKATLIKEEDGLGNLKDLIDVNLISVEVKTSDSVTIKAPVDNLLVTNKSAKVDIRSNVETARVSDMYQNIVISSTGVVENLKIDILATDTIIEGNGKLINLEDKGYGTINLMSKKPSEGNTDKDKEEYKKELEKAAEKAVEEAKKTYDKKDIDRAKKLVDAMDSGSKKDELKKELERFN